MKHVNCKAKTNARVSNWNVYTPNGIYNLLDGGFQEYTELIPSFYVERLNDVEICMSVRKELRSGSVHWYAYKRFAGKLSKAYVGQECTYQALWDAATSLPTDARTHKPYNENRRKPI